MRGKGGQRGGDEEGGKEKEIKREKTKARKTEAAKNLVRRSNLTWLVSCSFQLQLFYNCVQSRRWFTVPRLHFISKFV